MSCDAPAGVPTCPWGRAPFGTRVKLVVNPFRMLRNRYIMLSVCLYGLEARSHVSRAGK